MDKIKKLKIKKQDGTFSDYIPIGADAENIDTTDGESVEIKLNKKPYYYDTVADMKADTKLKAGDMAITLGYYRINDGGRGEYNITNNDRTEDGGLYHHLNNDLFAELVVYNNHFHPQQFGAYCDGQHDDSDALETCLRKANTAGLSNGTWRRMVYIPAVLKITREIICNTGTLTLYGISSSNSKILCDGENARIKFVPAQGINAIYDLEMNNITICGVHTNQQSLIEFNNCVNIYLERVTFQEGGVGQFELSFVDSGLVFIDKCTIAGSNNVTNYPGNISGISFDKGCGSIVNITNMNFWNLNKAVELNGSTQCFNLKENWIECVREVLSIRNTLAKDMRYMNINIENNMIDIHGQNTFIPSTFSIFSMDDLDDSTNWYGSKINISNNTIYLWNVETLKNDSVFAIPTMPSGSPNSSLSLIFNGNIFTGNTLVDLNDYLFKSSDDRFYTGYNVSFKSLIFNTTLEPQRISDKRLDKLVRCPYYSKNRMVAFPDGINLAEGADGNKGKIRYVSSNFFATYSDGTEKIIPEKVTTLKMTQADSSNYIQVINELEDILFRAHIADKNTSSSI